MGKTVRTHFHTNRLIELVSAQGGKTSEEAVAGANELVRSLRGFAMEGVEGAIRALETCVQTERAALDEADMEEILSYVDRLVMLASAFDLERLLKVSVSLGELVSGLSLLGPGPVEPIAVHVRAARLFAPASKLVPEADAQNVFAELRRVLKHFLRPSPVPENEPFRQAVLDRLNILDRPPQEPFDRLTNLAARYFKAPIALISLIDRDRQWFMARCGLEAEQTERDVAFCAHAIMTKEPLVVLDATMDPRFAANPLVTGEPYLRFYAGAPLTSPDGARIGTFCIIDTKARQEFNARDKSILMNFANRTVELIYAQVLEALSKANPKERLQCAREGENAISEAKKGSLLVFRSAIESQLEAIAELGRLLEFSGSGNVASAETISRAIGVTAGLARDAMRIALGASAAGCDELPRNNEQVDLKSAASKCIDALSPQLQAKSLELRVEVDSVVLLADAGQIEQLIYALLSRALESSCSESEVVLRISAVAKICEIAVGVRAGVVAGAPDKVQAVPEIVTVLAGAHGGATLEGLDSAGWRWSRVTFPRYLTNNAEAPQLREGGRP